MMANKAILCNYHCY